MGNDQSNGRMAIAAMANVMAINPSVLMQLREKCIELLTTEEHDEISSSSISRKDFRTIMAQLDLAETEDGEILDRLFTMFDSTGHDSVPCLSFLVGISPLASLDDVPRKLLFAFRIQDVQDSGVLSPEDIACALDSINATASYFGDAVMTSAQIESLTVEIADEAQDDRIPYADYVDKIASHPLVQQFVSGAGTVRYGTGK
mmetsp:Transcript_50813/g.75307  ORF Transcript_50813/g.75307 Transcript_50813/m.75307 type:complete len:202 (+) Transcript_50813:191-796(+)